MKGLCEVKIREPRLVMGAHADGIADFEKGPNSPARDVEWKSCYPKTRSVEVTKCRKKGKIVRIW